MSRRTVAFEEVARRHVVLASCFVYPASRDLVKSFARATAV